VTIEPSRSAKPLTTMGGMDRQAAPARLARTLAIALIAGALVPWPASAAEGDPSPTASISPAPSTEPTLDPAPDQASQLTLVAIDTNLYRAYAIVRQYTGYWCVPANAQTIVNLIMGRTDRSYATQARYAWHVKWQNRYTYPTRGNDPRGWSRFLDEYLPGDLHYRDWSFDRQADAIGAIVEALDRTGHPVGIVVDRGTHAWTVLGYRGSMVEGDPSSRVVDGFYVSGPLYRALNRPNREPWPYKFMALDAFGTRFGRYHESSRKVVWEGKFVIVAE
jgi:hypothetical protein